MKCLFTEKIIALFALMFTTGLIYAAEAHLNEGLPVMVDNNTELNDIQLENMTVCYVYNLKNMEADEALKERDMNRDFIEKNACNDDAIQELFAKDLKVKFIYYLDGKEILAVKVNKLFCQQLDRLNVLLEPNNDYFNI